jgi:hypothetical protein
MFNSPSRSQSDSGGKGSSAPVEGFSTEELEELSPSSFIREKMSRIIKTADRLANAPSGPDSIKEEGRCLLELFHSLEQSDSPIPVIRLNIERFLKTPHDLELRNSFLQNIVRIALRRADSDRKGAIDGSEEALKAALKFLESAGQDLVKEIFEKSFSPKNRCGIVELVGKVSKELQGKLFSSVLGGLIIEEESCNKNWSDPKSVAYIALRFHDSVRVLRKVETLFDGNSGNYEKALSPFRNEVRDSMAALVDVDSGETLMKILDRCLVTPLSFEDKNTVFPSIFSRPGKTRIKQELFDSLINNKAITSWLISDECRTELLPKPISVNDQLATCIIERAMESTIAQGEISDYARALIKLMRYLGKTGWANAPSLLGDEVCSSLERQALEGGEPAMKLYCEMIGAMSLVPHGCAVGMRSVFRVLTSEGLPEEAEPLLLYQLREGMLRYPEIMTAHLADQSTEKKSESQKLLLKARTRYLP